MAAQREGRRITQMQYFLQNGGLQALGLSKANFALTAFYEVRGHGVLGSTSTNYSVR
jgi:hypothetical protein